MKKGLKVIAILLMVVFALPLVSACGPKPGPEPEVAKITNYDLQLTEDESGYILTSYKDDTRLKKVEVPASHEGKPVVELGASLFRTLTSVEEIVLPSTVTKVGSSVFYGLKKLKTINTENITDFGVSAFENCEGLTTINIEKATKLGASVFKNCKYLSEITIPETCTEIPASAFAGCIRLVKAVLPETLETISASAFINCTSLSDIDLSKVSYIGISAFQNCASLTSVSLDNIIIAERHAFDTCHRLKTAYIGKKAIVIFHSVFYECVFLESVEIEKPDTPWIYVFYRVHGEIDKNEPMVTCWQGYDRFNDPSANVSEIFLAPSAWSDTLDNVFTCHIEYLEEYLPDMNAVRWAHIQNNVCQNCGLCIDRHEYEYWAHWGCGNPTPVK